MSRGFPSMTALLALLAVAGYQNRDKLGELLGSAGQQKPGAPDRDPAAASGLGGLLANLGGALSNPGGLLSGGLKELVDKFKASGQGETAESWVEDGPNKEVGPDQLRKAIGPDVLADLTKQTGLTEQELLARLSKTLPDAVDKYTPEGRLPT